MNINVSYLLSKIFCIKNYSPFIARELKKKQYYKGLLRKTDTLLHSQLVDYINKAFGNKKLKILDWGCGEGALAEYLSDSGHDVVAVDIDSSSWKGNKSIFFEIDFNNNEEVSKFIEKYSDEFDLIVCVEVIEHIESPWDLVRQLRCFNCDVILTTPNISSWWGRFWFFVTGDLWGFTERSWTDPGHINPVGFNEVMGLLADVGFEVKEVFPGGRLPIIWLYNWKRFLVSLLMATLRPFMRGYKDGWVLCFHACSKK